jgi:hypothetical protein
MLATHTRESEAQLCYDENLGHKQHFDEFPSHRHNNHHRTAPGAEVRYEQCHRRVLGNMLRVVIVNCALQLQTQLQLCQVWKQTSTRLQWMLYSNSANTSTMYVPINGMHPSANAVDLTSRKFARSAATPASISAFFLAELIPTDEATVTVPSLVPFLSHVDIEKGTIVESTLPRPRPRPLPAFAVAENVTTEAELVAGARRDSRSATPSWM